MKTAILGAGLAGLELGRRLQLRKRNFTIFEKESQIGGLAKTIRTGPFSWDYGVHAMYTKDAAVGQYFSSLQLDYQYHSRQVKIFHNGRPIPYPFENGIHKLPPRDRWECVHGYLTAAKKKKYANLEDWIENCLGRGISKHFMTPYCRKIWNCPLSEISMDLVANKIDPMSPAMFVLGALGWPTTGREYQAKFVYPRRGIQDFVEWTASSIRDKIKVNEEVKELEFKNERWLVNGYEFDHVVSTIPLPELLKKINLGHLRNSYPELRWNSTQFIMIGLKKGCEFGKGNNLHWAFFAGDQVFYRLTFMHNFSTAFPPAVVAEVTSELPVQKASFVLHDLKRAGILKSFNDVEFGFEKQVEYTYPIPTLRSKLLVEVLERELKKSDLHLLGRNGRWRYINMDGVIREVDQYVTATFNNRSRDSNRPLA